MRRVLYQEKYQYKKPEYETSVIKARCINLIPTGYTKKEWESLQSKRREEAEAHYQEEIRRIEQDMPDDEGINIDML